MKSRDNQDCRKPPGIFLRWNRYMPSLGALASGSFMIAAATGVFLAIPYDPAKAKESIQIMLIANPAATYIRSAHYWSSQFFLIFTMLHFLEYFISDGDRQVRTGVWTRLVIAMPAALFVMLSGFILKGDSEGFMAKQILGTLIRKIPSVGGMIEPAVMGTGESLSLIYMHHAATATIYILLIIIEHTKKIWPGRTSYILTLSATAILSFIIPAGLHPDTSDILKGPWYFIGLQEVLHWVSDPVSVIIFSSAAFILLIVFRVTEGFARTAIKYFTLAIIILYIITFIIGWFFRGENWKLILPWGA